MSLFELPANADDAGAAETLLTPPSDIEPSLAFMLAQQAITRWQFDLDRFAADIDLGARRDEAIAEAANAVEQIGALCSRIEPFAAFVDMAVRFEAEEVLASLEALRAQMERVVRVLSPEAPWTDPAQLVEKMQGRQH